MTTQSVRGRSLGSRPALRQTCWLAAGLALGFLIPFVLTDRLRVPRDLYYGIYALTVAAFIALWARDTDQPLGEMIRRRWKLAVMLGVGCAVLLAVVVTRTDAGTGRPSGLAFVGALAWRGLVYGATDGLFLSAFPILAVFAAAGPRIGGRAPRKVAVGLVALCASLAMTAAYHVGYRDFRSSKLVKPLTGDLIWSAPTLVTLNPVGAVISHVGLHMAAVSYSYETDIFLPPHDVLPPHEAPFAAR